MHYACSPTSQGMNMAQSQIHHWNSWVSQQGGCWAGQSCLSPRQQQAATIFSRRLTRSHFSKEKSVPPVCSIIFALAPNLLTFSSSKTIAFSLEQNCAKSRTLQTQRRNYGFLKNLELVPKFLLTFFPFCLYSCISSDTEDRIKIKRFRC